MLCLAILFFLGLSTYSVHATVPVEDPANLLGQIEASIGPADFARSFRCGEKALLRRFKENCFFQCEPILGCMSLCQNSTLEFLRTVTGCDAESASMVDGDGSVTLMARTDFEYVNGNLVRIQLGNLDVFFGLPGKVRLDSLTPVQYAPRTGAPVDALELKGTYIIATGGEASFDFTIGKNQAAPAQILAFKATGSKIYRVLEINP